MTRTPEHKRWYKTARWQRLRADQLKREPFCRFCKREGVSTIATVCDHIEPHRGDELKFWTGPFQSLCKIHHDRDKAILERGGRLTIGTDVDGWPIRPGGEGRGSFPLGS